MVAGWPIPYEPYLDPETRTDPIKDVREGLKADLRGWIEDDQLWIGLLSQLKEKAKDDPETTKLLEDLIQEELFLIKLNWYGANDLL